jgi:hypothetical protein
MADSRLTDLPNLTTPNSNDVLYIVDVTRDSSNKITYANLVTNTIDSLSAYLDSIDIPSINGLVTDVATLSVTQLTKANQADLNATNNSLNTLESNVAVYAGYITKNTGDIVALSGYIDTKALNSDLNATNTRVDEISGTLSTKASQDEVGSKASQDDVDVITTNVNVISSNVNTNNGQLSGLTITQNQHSQDIIILSGNSVSLSEFNTLSGTVNSQIAELSAAVGNAATVDMKINLPFNISLTSQTNLLTTYYGITALSGNPELTPSDIAIIQVTAGLNGGKNWDGLLTNVYPISTGAIQVSVFNPTPNTISFNNTEIILYMESGQTSNQV